MDEPGSLPETYSDLAVEQLLAVLRERQGISDRIVYAYPDKPVERQVEVQQLHRAPLRTDAMKQQQQQRPQQPLRRNRRPRDVRIGRLERRT